MSATNTLVGRIPRSSTELDPILGALALASLMSVPFLMTKAALGVLALGGLIMLRNPQLMTTLFLRYWMVLALPAFCAVSFLWSRVPGESFRFGLQLGATFAIAIAIAGTMSPRLFARTMFWVLALFMFVSVAFGATRGDTGALLGLYGSKNAMAGAAAVFTTVSASLALGRDNPRLFRLLAAGFALFGAGIVALAQSASAIIALPVALTVLVATSAMHRLPGPGRALLVIFGGLFGVLLVLLTIIFFDVIFGTLLDVTGKDITLTGRTELWTIALDFIAERPLLGVGYQAFWVQGHAPAEALWMMFGITTRSGFHFHNTYLSNAVEIGVIGVALQSGILFVSTYLTALWAIRSGSSEASLFFVQNVLLIMATFFEVPVFFQFSLRSFVVVAALVFAHRALKELRQARSG